MVPRSDESAGKRRRPPAAGRQLAQDHDGAVRVGRRAQEGLPVAALFERLNPKRGARRAICAVAAEMLRTIYHMLKDGTLL